MSDRGWMDEEGYGIADRVIEQLDKAYNQGAEDAWNSAKLLWNKNEELSFTWTAEQMMLNAERVGVRTQEVRKLAERLGGIEALYEVVCAMRGENDETD